MNPGFRFFLLLVLLAAGPIPGCKGCMEPPPTPHKAAMERITVEEDLIRKMALPPRKGVLPTPAGEDSTVELVVALPTLPDHLNPFLEIDEWGFHIAMHHIYEGLLDRDPKTGRLVGALAESWSSDEKGSAYRFRLRTGVRWQDGRPFTVEDVVFTFNMLTMPKIDRGPFIYDIDHAITRVDKFGPDEVRVVLNSPNIYFLDHLVELPILPAHVFFKGVSPKSRGSLSPVGTGPYRLLQWEGSDQLVLEKNEYYWGPTPDVGRVVFRRFPDAARSFVGIRRKQVHVLPRVTPAHYPDQITDTVSRDYELVRFVPPQFTYLLWNVANPMLADFRIRRALSMLIDRDRVIEKVFRGLATPCTGPFWQPGGLGDVKLENWPYDPPAARDLLTQVDWVDHDGDGIRDKGGTPLRLVVLVPVAARQGTEMLQIMKSDFQKAGVDLVIVPTDWKLMGAHLRKRQFSAALLSWSGRPYEDFSPLFHSTGRYNYGVVYNTMIDQLLVSMRRTTRLEARFDFSVKLEDMLHAYLPMTFLVRPVWIGLVHRDFTNAIPTPHGFRYSQFKHVPRQPKDADTKRPSPLPPNPEPPK
ncbi:MAG: hypothetical protein CVU59_05485 [Deltaproteobacteria bacterium HGW-Deltaproteobacteria-17]|nr:MAG: hypothetical protein CVU59_05485 [Deltaproteobacteria bacterium HGW-Deltaproteobacteria-17]